MSSEHTLKEWGDPSKKHTTNSKGEKKHKATHTWKYIRNNKQVKVFVHNLDIIFHEN
jgi:hypothetical protein